MGASRKVSRFRVFETKTNRSQNGFMAAEWSVGIAILLFPAFVLVLNLIQIPTRQSLVQEASSAAARAYVQALDQSQAVTVARAAAEEVVLQQFPSASQEELDQIKVEVVSSSLYCWGNEVSIRVTVPAPIILNPFSNYENVSNGLNISSTSTERIDDYAELADAETGSPTYPYDDCDGP